MKGNIEVRTRPIPFKFKLIDGHNTAQKVLQEPEPSSTKIANLAIGPNQISSTVSSEK